MALTLQGYTNPNITEPKTKHTHTKNFTPGTYFNLLTGYFDGNRRLFNNLSGYIIYFSAFLFDLLQLQHLMSHILLSLFQIRKESYYHLCKNMRNVKYLYVIVIF